MITIFDLLSNAANSMLAFPILDFIFYFFMKSMNIDQVLNPKIYSCKMFTLVLSFNRLNVALNSHKILDYPA